MSAPGATVAGAGRGAWVERVAVGALYVAASWIPVQYLPTRALHLLPLAFVWVDDAALVLAAALGLLVAATRSRDRLRTPLDLPVVACVIGGLLSAALNGVSSLHLVLGLRGPLQPLLAFYALWWLRPSAEHLRRLGALSLALALAQAPVALVQFLLTRTAMSRDLVHGTFWVGASNSMAYYLLFFVLPLAGVAAASPGRRAALVGAGLLLVPFVLASSRGALLLLPFVALTAVWPWVRRSPRALGRFAALAVVAGLGVALFHAFKPPVDGAEIAGELSPRRLYLEQWNRRTGMARLHHLRWVAQRMETQGPTTLLLGLGPGRFSSSAGSYLRAPLLEEATRGGHSPIIPGQLTATFSEYGLAGLANFGWLVTAGILLARRSARRLASGPDADPAVAGLARGLFAATLFLVLGMPLENVWELPHVAVLAWAGVGWGAIAGGGASGDAGSW